MSPAMNPVRPSENRHGRGLPALQLKNQIKALLVDSDRSCQMAQSSFLRYYGVETQTATNGLSAYMLASNSSFDLIIIDISLPVMNGLEAIRYMRARGVTCKIVGMAGCWCEMHKQAILDAGADIAMEKPLFLGTMVPILRELDGEL
ncbi:unnamed protein product [Dovyalis caffra]|uniref:Response regulatory domain-containing protein n=1 Tax=Dovyalis caffra TaxID=77055 RepID=A0AAV1SGB3_9ROSI|nr:unnamed protein product [Dovyalis caffra]